MHSQTILPHFRKQLLPFILVRKTIYLACSMLSEMSKDRAQDDVEHTSQKDVYGHYRVGSIKKLHPWCTLKC